MTFAAQRGVNGGDQVIPRRQLQDESQRAGLQPARHQAAIAVHGDEHDPGVGVVRRISAAAVSPSTSGIEMSLTITSGDNRQRA